MNYLFALIAVAFKCGFTLVKAGPDSLTLRFNNTILLEIATHFGGRLIAQLTYYKDSNNFDFIPFNMTGEYNTELANIKDFEVIFNEIKDRAVVENNLENNPNSLVDTSSELRDLVQIQPNEDQWLDGRGPMFQ